MPKKEDDIKNNSMKLYSYLITIAGLADYPDNTRMFRQKDLVLSKIKEATGITDKTVKLYLYYLEEHRLVKYRGECQFDFLKLSDFKSSTDYRIAAQNYAAEVWKIRKQDKLSVYHIPRPIPYTPVPEITLERLNKDFQVTELELKIYLFCCSYRDACVKMQKKYKAMTYEQFRDILDLKKENFNNKKILNALCFLEKIGLISFKLGFTTNNKLAKIPVFKITNVEYYIQEPIIDFSKNEILSNEEYQEIEEEIKERVELGYNKFKERMKDEE